MDLLGWSLRLHWDVVTEVRDQFSVGAIVPLRSLTYPSYRDKCTYKYRLDTVPRSLLTSAFICYPHHYFPSILTLTGERGKLFAMVNVRANVDKSKS